MDRLFQLTTKNLLGALNLVLVILCAYAAAHIVHDLRRPAPELKTATLKGGLVGSRVSPPRTFNAYKPILDRNLFKSALAVAPPPTKEADEVPEEVEETPLQAKLIATVVTRDEKKSTATIEDLTARSRDLYRVDDTLMKEAKVARIERERVIVLRKGKHEKLSLYEEEDEGATPKPTAARAPVLNHKVAPPRGLPGNLAPRSPRRGAASGAMNAVSEFNSKGNGFRVMPNYQKGHMRGFRIFAVTPDSNWARSGLRNGDVIESINGREVSNSNDVAELLAELRNTGSVEWDVMRGGKPQKISNGGGS